MTNRFAVLIAVGADWDVVMASTLKDARKAARSIARGHFWWITDHATGKKYGLRGEMKSK